MLAMKASLHIVVAALTGLFMASQVYAQGFPGAPGSPESIPEKDRSRPEDQPKSEPRSEDGVTTGRSLSEQLDESGGVIKPPKGIDPEMVKPAPDTGTMKVIPPPETQKGAPGPEPK
jgi:hypothetical protein